MLESPSDPSLRCFRCDRELDLIDGEPGWPHDAVVFAATGNYGSRLWDPGSPGLALEIVACDACLADRALDGGVARVERRPGPATVVRTRFDPTAEAHA